MAFVSRFPAFAKLMLFAAALMLVPALHAAKLENWDVARGFLYHGIFFAICVGILGIATMNIRPERVARYELLTLVLTYLLLPLMLAAPLVALVPGLGLAGGYFEMLSCLTTTGATLFDRPNLLPEPIHLWRALVGWMGGLLILVTAFAVLAPMNLGGFEITQAVEQRRSSVRSGTLGEAARRIERSLRAIVPPYGLMTGALALFLILAGDRPFIAVCHAMSTLSTSGISPVGGIAGAQSGRLGEIAIAAFLLLAISHRGLRLTLRHRASVALADPQVQLMLISVLGITLLLFLRSFIGAAEIDRQDNIGAALQAVWGSLFTTLSFLTTAGFVSHDWRAMQLWSDLPDPGIVLLGLAVMGGGIATTAGGVKLLRLYALYRSGLREMDKLIHPSGLGRRGQGDQLISPNGARVAFIFLLLFLIATALTMIGLTATGVGFDHALGLAIASLTTTGPAIEILGGGFRYSDLSEAARAVLSAAMIVGRVEALVILALFNPLYWRA